MALGTGTTIALGVASGIGIGAGGTYLLCKRAQKKRDEELKGSMQAIADRMNSFTERFNKASSPEAPGGGASKAVMADMVTADSKETAQIVQDLINHHFTKPKKDKDKDKK